LDRIDKRPKLDQVARALFIIVSATSLLLCATAVVFWIRSYQPRDAVGRDVNQEYQAAD